jgi:hypothetical protein
MQSAPLNIALMLKGGEDIPVEGYNPFDEIKGRKPSATSTGRLRAPAPLLRASTTPSSISTLRVVVGFRRSLCCHRLFAFSPIAASSRARERNKLMSADHNRMKISTIGHKHHPIRRHSPTI